MAIAATLPSLDDLKAQFDKPDNRLEVFDVVLANGYVRRGESIGADRIPDGERINHRAICKVCRTGWDSRVHGC